MVDDSTESFLWSRIESQYQVNVYLRLLFFDFAGWSQDEIEDRANYRDKNHDKDKHYIIISLKFAFKDIN